MGPQPYHCCEIVEVLTDRDVISYAFCLDGFTLLSLAHGACLTKPLTHRLHASHKLTVFLVICLRSYDCVSHMSQTTTTVLPHSISSLQPSFCFVFVHLLLIRQLLAPDFSQALAVSGLHTNSANGLSLNRLSGENSIHMEAVIENLWS